MLSDTRIAYASRTDKPAWAAACLELLQVGGSGVSMAEAAEFKEIGGGECHTC
jgi:hypothetical protein